MNQVTNLPITAIFAPFMCAFIVALCGERWPKFKKAVTIVATVISLIAMFMMVKPVLIEKEIITYWLGNWTPIENWAVGIGLEIDAFGLMVGLIITFTCFLSSLYSVKYMEKDNGHEKYYALFLLLAGSMIAYSLSGDLFNMYVMIEIMTFSAIALTSFRNHLYKSIEAGFKYLVIGSLGSSLILLGTVLLYGKTATLNIAQISAVLSANGFDSVTNFSLGLMLTGYAVKAFLVPCHTWPPDAHMSAPSSISMLLSGVMSKTGILGIIRILFMMYSAQVINNRAIAGLIIVWGAITMIVGATMAIVQTDFKRLLAFSSVSQIGYVVVGFGIGMLGVEGASMLGTYGGIYHMINHATFKCLLFLCAGAVLYKTGTTDTRELGGLYKKMPLTTILFVTGAAAIAGIPPFNGFVSKWMIYRATFEAGYWPVTIVALVVSVMTLAYMVKLGHTVFFGNMSSKVETIEKKDVSLWMSFPMIILAILCSVQGLFWNSVSKYIIEPVANSLYNIKYYIAAMFNEAYVSTMFTKEISIPALSKDMVGYYSPINWLILFVILLIGFMLMAYMNMKRNTISVGNEETRFDIFTGGEKEDATHMTGDDMFWGLRHQFKGYFEGMRRAHSGVVNDYVLWVVCCVAFVTTYIFLVL